MTRAEHAAKAVEAVNAQNKFWQMHDYLYEHQTALSDAHLEEYVQIVGLDVPCFTQEMSDHLYANRVHQDFESGVGCGVNGTPTFFINGIRHDGSIERNQVSSAN